MIKVLSWKSWTSLHSTTTPQCASYRAALSLWEYALKDWGLNSLYFRRLLCSHRSASPRKVHIILVLRSHKALQMKNCVSVFASRSSVKMLNQILCLHLSLYLITWMQERSEKHNRSILIFQKNLQSKTVGAHRPRFSYIPISNLCFFSLNFVLHFGIWKGSHFSVRSNHKVLWQLLLLFIVYSIYLCSTTSVLFYFVLLRLPRLFLWRTHFLNRI